MCLFGALSVSDNHTLFARGDKNGYTVKMATVDLLENSLSARHSLQ